MPKMDRRSAMMMAGLGLAVVAVPTPTAGANPMAPEPPLPVPEPPVGPPPPPGFPPPPPPFGAPPPPEAAAPPGFQGDEFDGPAGAPPNPALWTVVPRREMIKKPVFWDRPENMGEYSTDQEHVFLDGNSNLVIRATRNPGGNSQSNTYTGGKVIGNFGAPINNTFEARVKFECLTPGAWPAWWLLNDQDKKRGGEVDIMEWYGNMEWPSGTTLHARLDGTSFATMPFPVDDQWHRWRVTWNQSGMYFYADYQPGMEPYFSVPAFSIDDWAFNDPGFVLRPVFNLAVGGTGGKDASPGIYPCQLLVDWVHIFPG